MKQTGFEYAAIAAFMVAGVLLPTSLPNFQQRIVNKVGQAVVHNQLACAYAQKALDTEDPEQAKRLDCLALPEFKKAFELNPQDADVYHNLYLILQKTGGLSHCKEYGHAD